jgi:uncharacterized protein with HEPN domain
MLPDDRARLQHMSEAIDQIAEFLNGRSAQDLETDRVLLFAIVRALEVLGEAASGVSPETRLVHLNIPWNLIVATRNRLIHGYFDIDPEIVWRTASVEVPAILPDVRQALEQFVEP